MIFLYITLPIGFLSLGILQYLLYRELNRKVSFETDLIRKQIQAAYSNLKSSIDKVHTRIDGLFAVDPPTENEATKKDANVLDLSEEQVYDLPADIKFKVEGGDVFKPVTS